MRVLIVLLVVAQVIYAEEETSTEPSSAEENVPEDKTEDLQPARIYNDPHFVDGRSVIVHLHEWTYKDIARECEEFLGPKGYGGVQTSPASENLVIKGRPWYERYQPISYNIATRSGNAKEFLDMATRCNRVGVRIYVDVVPNHMSADADGAVGTDGTVAYPSERDYPGVPYTIDDFHAPCQIENFDDKVQARKCELVGLHDLDQSRPRVQWAIINFLDRLTALGAAGFRVDATKHMQPEDLVSIYEKLQPLYTRYGFAEGSLPFIYQEVGDGWKFEYLRTGAVTEFAHPSNMAAFFKNYANASALREYGGKDMGMLESNDALVFVDNHDLQRQNDFTLNYKSAVAFRAAYAFTLAYPYGIARVMSSFDFKTDVQGPPHDSRSNILRPLVNGRGQCYNGWVCEHRWPAIVNMVRFRKAVGDAPVQNWYDDAAGGVLAFCRGSKGFIAISAGRYDFAGKLQTCLPAGTYCALGKRLANGTCRAADRIIVKQTGSAEIKIPKNAAELFVAILPDDLVESNPYSE